MKSATQFWSTSIDVYALSGMIINTHDWRLNDDARYAAVVEAHEENGWNLGVQSRTPPAFDFNELLLENCTLVMEMYQ